MSHYPILHPALYSAPRYGASSLGDFTQGMVAAGCVSAFQDVANPGARENRLRVLRHALQGGTALAAGACAADAVRRGDYARALVAAGLGAVGVLALENLMADRTGRKEGEARGNRP